MKHSTLSSSSNSGNTNVGDSLPSEEELYYEYSFRKHCYKFERGDIGYICVTDEDKKKALQKMFDEIKVRQQ